MNKLFSNLAGGAMKGAAATVKMQRLLSRALVSV